MNYFINLPKETIEKIFEYINFKDILNMRLVHSVFLNTKAFHKNVTINIGPKVNIKNLLKKYPLSQSCVCIRKHFPQDEMIVWRKKSKFCFSFMKNIPKKGFEFVEELTLDIENSATITIDFSRIPRVKFLSLFSGVGDFFFEGESNCLEYLRLYRDSDYISDSCYTRDCITLGFESTPNLKAIYTNYNMIETTSRYAVYKIKDDNYTYRVSKTFFPSKTKYIKFLSSVNKYCVIEF